MSLNLTTYNSRITPMHAVDARVKVVLALVYSFVLFALDTWWGMAACAVLLAAAGYAARLPLRQAMRQLAPLALVLAVMLAANSFSFDAENGTGRMVGGFLSGFDPVPLTGGFAFVPAGFECGCFYALRIVALVCASLVLTTTTTSTQLSYALSRFLHPFARFGVPVNDIATIVSIALRFIPVTIDEFQMVRAAQCARAAQFDTGNIVSRLKAWSTVLIPLFVGLFRRADKLATAMDARCYGQGEPTHLDAAALAFGQVVAAVCGAAACIAIGVAL